MALGLGLRLGQTFLRVLQFCCAAVVLGVFSYYLAVMNKDNIAMPTYVKAVEGMSGGAALYTVFAVILTCCLGGVAFFGFIAVVLDILFIACFAAIAYYTRDGTHSCRGNLNTPLGSGPDDQEAPGTSDYHFVCRLETVCFAVSLANCFLFLITAWLQILMVRSHKRDKRFGPGPSNNYTSGTGRRPFWSRKHKVNTTRDANLTGAGAVRPSHETGMTGSTINGGYAEPKYGHQPLGVEPSYQPPSRHAAANY